MRSILFILCFLQYGYLAKAQKVEWLDAPSKQYHGTSNGEQVIHIKNSGKVYCQSGISDTFSFHAKTFRGYYYNLITCYDTTGKFRWTKQINNFNTGYYYYDAFISGHSGFKGNFYYATAMHDSYTKKGFFLTESDSLGNDLWTHSIIDSAVGNSYITGQQMVSDDSGHIYFLLTDNYSNGQGFTAQGKSYNFHSNNFTEFIVKTDSLGTIIWLKPFLQDMSGNFDVAICVNKQGNIYFNGSTTDNTITAQGTTYLSSYGFNTIYQAQGHFIGKLNKEGSFAWFHFFDDIFGYSSSCDVDSSGNMCAKMLLRGSADLGGLKISSPFNYSAFLVKFNAAGVPLWAGGMLQLQSESNDIDFSEISLDHHGNCYMAGSFSGIIFTGRDTLAAGANTTDANAFYVDQDTVNFLYINKCDSAGVLQWCKIFKTNQNLSTSSSAIDNIASDDNGTVYFTGRSEDSIYFDNFKVNDGNNNPMLFAGKLGYPPVYPPDSIGYVHSCGRSSFNFHLYYYTTPDSVLWSFGDGMQSRQFQPAHVYTKPGTYSVKVIVYVQGLVKSFSDMVTYIIFPSKLLPRDTTLCVNAVLNLNCTVPSATNYIWNNGDTMPIRTLNQAGFYKITVSGGGCSKSDSFNLAYDNHGYNLGNDTTLCQGDTLVLAGPTWPNDQYQWNTGSTGQLLYVTAPNAYILAVYDGTCHFADTINVKYDLFPARVLPSDTVICDGQSIPVSIKNFNGSILWQDGKTDSDYTINSSGTYSVTLKNLCGTKTYASTITDSNCDCYLFIPNIFTPNNDHINDIFYVESACEPVNYTLEIYNRWGERIFESNNINTGWDGTFKNLTCPGGVYIYKIKYKFSHSTNQIKAGTLVVE